MNKIKSILVTGGAGYIGSHTVVQLVEAGYNPIVVDDFRNSNPDVMDRLREITGREIPLIQIDICDKEGMENALNGIEVHGIIHFAAYKAVGESVAEPLKYYQNNVSGTATVLDWAKRKGVNQIVFSSSCTVYGEPKGQKEVSEETPAGNANSPYGYTKVIGEQMLQDLKMSGAPFRMMALRYFNPIGAHPSGLIGELPVGRPNNLLPFVTQTALGLQKELVVFGNDYPTPDGTCIRDYIHVVDLAQAHVQAMMYLEEQPDAMLEFVNIGTGKGSSTLEIIETFERISGKTLNWRFGPRRAGDVVEIFANAGKAKDLLNWRAEKSLEDAIADAWNWEQKRTYEQA